MIEGAIFRYTPSCSKAEVTINYKVSSKSEFVDISALTPQKPGDEDNLSLDVFNVLDVKEDNVWFPDIIISDLGGHADK